MGGTRWVLAGAMFFVMGQACSSATPRPPKTASSTALGDAYRKVSGAMHSLVAARCAREQRCGQVGPDAKYETLHACQARMRVDLNEQLNATACPSGVRESALEACLEELREERCGDPFDTLSRRLTCGQKEMCGAGG